MDDFYTDEPIDFGNQDGMDDADAPDSLGNEHNWDYYGYEPDENDIHPWESLDNSSPEDIAGLPQEIVELEKMIRTQPWEMMREKNFYDQAQFMADYTDSADIVPFFDYFPVYSDMTVEELRSYFTIRTMWRQGKFPEVALSYIFVYIYELLMQVGIDHPEDGYELLQELLAAYSPTYEQLPRYLKPWLQEYVVYYNLPSHFQEVFADERHNDALAAVLADYKHVDGATLFDVLLSLSGYNPADKALFKKAPEKVKDCMVDVLRAIIPTLEQVSHHHIETLCLGSRSRRQIRMFANAVFYDPRPVRSAEINVSPRVGYFCRGGLWSKNVFAWNKPQVKRLLGVVFHEIDRQLRVVFGVKPALKPKVEATPYAAAIKEAIAQWVERERAAEAAREAERRRVSIDFSKLGKIRSDAEVVMEKLATDGSAEPVTAGPIDSVMPTAPVVPTAPDKPIEPSSSLSAPSAETAFLRLFLSGGDWRGFLRDHHIPEGVMVEKINDMAMDNIGDIVLEDDGMGLKLIEDYRADVEQWLKDNS